MERYNITHDYLLEGTKDLTPFDIVYLKHNWKQFKSCQVWYCDCKVTNKNTGELLNGYILQSYGTYACLYIPRENLVIRLKYSTTTSKQITQWLKQMHCINPETVYFYSR